MHYYEKNMAKYTIPQEVLHVTKTLKNKGFDAYLVGGCVRDLIREEQPKDWDITTNATPEGIQKIFEKTFYENDYGTVGVVNEEATDETLNVVEVTPYRIEGKYTDGRRPDSVHFSDNLEDDLKRRDFTINALAYDISKGQIIDIYKGQEDIRDKTIRSVGNPETRFSEDYLRMLRGVRLATELGFVIQRETKSAIVQHADKIKEISQERINTEFSKLILSREPKRGIELLHKTGLLAHILPELEEGIGCKQNGDHIYEVWEHNLRALQHAADRAWPLHVRLAALLHDIGKPATRRWSKEKNDWTFYGHDVVGGRMAKKILERLRYGKQDIDRVQKLVRHHLFFSDIEKITLSAVRRIVRNVGPENVWDLMKVRACDRIGMGRPKETPYRLRKYEAMIEEAMRAPISVGMLKTNGARIMEITNEKPGPKIGFILHALLEEVLDNPDKNTVEHLDERAKKLAVLSEKKLKVLGEAGKQKKDAEEEKELKVIRKRHFVK